MALTTTASLPLVPTLGPGPPSDRSSSETCSALKDSRLGGGPMERQTGCAHHARVMASLVHGVCCSVH